MHFATVSTLSLLLSAASSKHCINQTISVQISARNGLFGNVVVPQTNHEVTNMTLLLTKQGYNFSSKGLTDYETVSGVYQLHTQYCTPDSPSEKQVAVQILTHGIGFDRTYWDIAYDDFAYSYINNAVDKHGFSTLSYDRLGIGQSQQGEPLNEVQSFLEIAALRAVTLMLRNGEFPGQCQNISKIIHVGHSFGALQTYALTAAEPDISDGIVLTGYSADAGFLSYFNAGANWMQAALNVPERHGNLPRGYFVTSGKNALQFEFLLPGYFDPGILDFAEAAKQPVTIGELLTLSAPTSSAFAKPVLVFTGSNDVPFCGGDCMSTGGVSPNSIPGMVSAAFPNATNFEAYIQPNTAHGLNQHYNASAGYDVIASYLISNGLNSV